MLEDRSENLREAANTFQKTSRAVASVQEGVVRLIMEAPWPGVFSSSSRLDQALDGPDCNAVLRGVLFSKPCGKAVFTTAAICTIILKQIRQSADGGAVACLYAFGIGYMYLQSDTTYNQSTQGNDEFSGLS